MNRKKILTAYKEQALRVARLLRDEGPLTVDEVKRRGGPSNAGAILGRNVLRWFDREAAPGGRRYLYRVNLAGLEALEMYGELL